MKYLAIVLFSLFSIQVMAQLDSPNGLKVGDEAPLFTATDVNNDEEITLKSYLGKGYVLLVFYRGEWCKYCNKHLSLLEEWKSEIEASNIQIMSIAPQTAENVRKTIDKTDASYIMISDSDFSIMEAYDLDFTVDDATLARYETYDIDISEANDDDTNTLTVPASYLIAPDGKIIFVHFDEDYKERSLPENILEAFEAHRESEKNAENKR